MSMNQFMHPRNIYKQPPNFKQLALDFPEFRKYVKTDIAGKVTMDFKNLEALRALSCTLLKKDFGLQVKIPSDKLIPTIPLRLNYVLWVEDLLSLLDNSDNIKGIDIGTGASCVYPLIAAKKNNWSLVATEIDPESIKYAIANVTKNSLDNLIKVVQVSKDHLLKEITTILPDHYDFCMCNPPFFSSPQELHPFFKSRKQNRPHPKNAFCASVGEVVSKGGEVEYISRLIAESKEIGNKVKIYTTMIGHKSSLPPLKRLLREIEVISFKQTEFCQGNTTRWGLAWTFLDIDLRKIPEPLLAAKKQQPKPIIYAIPKSDRCPYKLHHIVANLIHIFNDLQIDYQEIKHIKNYVEIIITAYSNTWSHQRRKRREKLRLNSSSGSSGSDNLMNNSSDKVEIDNTCNQLAEMSFPDNKSKINGTNVKQTIKRSLDDEDDEGYYDSKKLRTSLDEFDPSKIYLKGQINVLKDENCIGLELKFIEGNGTKDALHQVLQYIKNNLCQND